MILERRARRFVSRFCGSGADRDRTDDLLLAKQVLYQLSYRPKKTCCYLRKRYSGFFTFPSTALEQHRMEQVLLRPSSERERSVSPGGRIGTSPSTGQSKPANLDTPRSVQWPRRQGAWENPPPNRKVKRHCAVDPNLRCRTAPSASAAQSEPFDSCSMLTRTAVAKPCGLGQRRGRHRGWGPRSCDKSPGQQQMGSPGGKPPCTE